MPIIPILTMIQFFYQSYVWDDIRSVKIESSVLFNENQYQIKMEGDTLVVGSHDFRQKCVDDMKNFSYPNFRNFFEKFLSGEDFNYEQLMSMGYDHWSARNIDEYIHHSHNDGYYRMSLCWE